MRGIATGGSRGPKGADGANGVGVPVGGTTGQVLAKNSNTDFDTGWVDVEAAPGEPAAGENMYVKKLLYDNTLIAPGTWDVQNIPQEYDHLEIYIYGRRESNASATANVVNFNGDATTTNYGWISHYGGSTHTSSFQPNTPYFGWVSGTTIAGSFATTFGMILNYSMNNSLKTLVGKSYFDESVRYLSEESLRWASNAAINRISFVVAGGTNYAAGSRLQIFGVGNRPTGQGISSAYVGEQLFRQVVGAGGQANFDITAIPAGYDSIKVFLQGKSEVAGSGDHVLLAFNGDTTNTNYRYSALYTDGVSPAAINGGDTRNIGTIGGANSAPSTGHLEITLINPSSSTEKIASSISPVAYTTSQSYIQAQSVHWENTAAISRITLTTNSGSDFAEGTLCTVVAYRNRLIQPAPKTSLISNGEFESGIDGWSATSPALIAHDNTNKRLTVSRNNAGIDVMMGYTSFPATIGRLYQVSLTVASASADTAIYIKQNTSEKQIQKVTVTPASVNFIIRATAATIYLIIKPTNNTSATSSIESVFVVEL